MMQFLRSSTGKNRSELSESSQSEKLKAGQPFYDIKDNKLYIGDGKTMLINLPAVNPDPSGYELPKADSDTLGGIKTGYTQKDKNYAVQLDSNSKAYVSVPWTDTDTKYDDSDLKKRLNDIEDALGDQLQPKIAYFKLTLTNQQLDLLESSPKCDIGGFTHRETNVDKIDKKLTFSGNGTRKSDIFAKSSDATVIFDEVLNITSADLKNGVTYILSGTSTSAKPFSSTQTIIGYWPYLAGVTTTALDSLTADALKSMTHYKDKSSITSVDTGTTNGYFVIACPNSIKPNVTLDNFEFPMGIAKNIAIGEQSYYVYQSNLLEGNQQFIIKVN